jgi:glycosyltransferase involved in cell wall biosynthesis
MTFTPKKIVLLAHEDLYGGGTRQTYYIMEALVQAGHQPILISNAETTWLGQHIIETGLPVKTYYCKAIQRNIDLLKEFRAFFHILTVLGQEKPDALMASGVKLIGLASLAGFLTGIKQRYAIIRGEGAPPGSLQLKIIYAMQRFVAVLGTQFITVSDYIRKQMLLHQLCKPDRVASIVDGTDVVRFASGQKGLLRKQFNIPEHALVVGMVGRLCAGKRYEDFIDMMQILCGFYPHVYGLLIGEGDDRAVLQAQIEDTGYPDRILITGFLPNMPDVYADLNVSVLLTDYEGCPNGVLESMASKIPVVATAVTGLPEIIDSGVNGILVPIGDVSATAQAVDHLMNHLEVSQRMVEKAYETIDKRFNKIRQIDCVVNHLVRSPAQLLRERSKR